MKNTDKLTICHIWNAKKTYLPFNMKPDAVRSNYEAETVTYSDRVLMFWQERDENIST